MANRRVEAGNMADLQAAFDQWEASTRIIVPPGVYEGQLRVGKYSGTPVGHPPLEAEFEPGAILRDSPGSGLVFSVNWNKRLNANFYGDLLIEHAALNGVFIGRSGVHWIDGTLKIDGCKRDGIKIVGTDPFDGRFLEGISFDKAIATRWGEGGLDNTGASVVSVKRLELHHNDDKADGISNGQGVLNKNMAENVRIGELYVHDCNLPQSIIGAGGRMGHGSDTERYEVDGLTIGKARFERVTTPRLICLQAARDVRIHDCSSVDCNYTYAIEHRRESVEGGLQAASLDCRVNGVEVTETTATLPVKVVEPTPDPTPPPTPATEPTPTLEERLGQLEVDLTEACVDHSELMKRVATLENKYATLEASIKTKSSGQHHHDGRSQLVHVKAVPTGPAVEPEEAVT